MANQETTHINLCRQCAEELGFISPMIPSITISFSLAEDAPRARRVRKTLPKRKEQSFDSLVCPSCGLSFSAFREEGLLGCPRCYEEFRFPLGAFLQKTQGAESHWIASDIFDDISLAASGDGVTVEENEPSRDVLRLRLELSDAISREDYERAAQLRDMLAPLSGGSVRDDA
jgi:protein arginine kinase activator